MSIAELQEVWEHLSPEDQTELLALIYRDGSELWYSLPGPQSEARYSEADITGYGGAAGGGKTDLACGLAVVDHEKTTIFRNEAGQLEAVKERFEELLGTRRGLNGQTGVWRFEVAGKRKRVRLGGFPNPGDEKRYQGSPNDLVVFDEAAEMRETAVRFVIGWNRSAKRKQRTRIILTFNPPTRPEGRWIISFFAPWLDKRHPMYPTPPGVLRWATTGPDGQDFWLETGAEFVWIDGRPCYEFERAKVRVEDVVQPMSRTFIPARLVDNPFLIGGAYLARLQNFPEPLRSQMLYGDFEAGMKDDEWQVIPTKWLRLSMARWKAAKAIGPAFQRGPMSSLGVDVARGGRDKFVIAPRYGRFVDELIRYPGAVTKTGPIGAAVVMKHRRNQAPVHVDVIGWGSSTHDSLVEQGVQSVPINVSSGSTGAALGSGMKFLNKRAEVVWRLYEALDPELGEDALMLPDDPQLEMDLAAYRWRPSGGKIQIMSKEEMQKRIGRSPDDGDAVCLALLDTMKAETALEMYAEVVAAKQRDGDPWALWGD